MQLYLHPHERPPGGLPVEILLSVEEAERWISELRSAVRGAREGQGDQLRLLGEPAQIVLTVTERPNRLPTPPDPDPWRIMSDLPEPRDFFSSRALIGLPVFLAMLIFTVFLIFALKFIP